LAEQIYPRIRDTMQTHTMIFIPHYFESDGPAPLRPMLSVVFMSPRRGCPSVGASSCVPWTRAHTRLHSPSHSLNARSAALHCGGCAPITAVHVRGAGAAQAAQFCFVMLASIHRRVYAMPCTCYTPCAARHDTSCALRVCAALGGFVRLRNFFRREETLSFCSLCESVAPLHRSAPSPLRAPLHTALRPPAPPCGWLDARRTHARALALMCAD
jgi:hypothetical protein